MRTKSKLLKRIETVKKTKAVIRKPVARTAIAKPIAKVATPPAPAARVPSPAQLDRRHIREARDRAERIAKLTASVGKATKGHTKTRTDNFVGLAAGAGWYLAATDGHRGIILPGVATKDTPAPKFMTRVAALRIDLTQDLVAAFRRMAAVSGKDARVNLALAPDSATRGVLTLSAKDEGVDAAEPVDVTGDNLRMFTAGVNSKYFLAAAGLYPATLHVSTMGSGALLQIVCEDVRMLISGIGPGTFLAGEAKDSPARPPKGVTTSPAIAAAAAATTAPAAPRVRAIAPKGDTTPCPCCGQASVARAAATGKTRFSHKCPHGNPCPTGVAKKTIAACPICRDAAAGVAPARQAVSA